MKKLEVLLAVAIVVALILSVYIFFQSKTSFKKVKIGNVTIDAEVADTTLKRIKGLMFRQSLADKNGMLFLFDTDDYHGIWMMNMSFPIDIIWINSEHKIVDIVKDAQPCRIICPVYKSKEKTRYVLEVNAGFTDKYSVDIGDSVKF